jgi:4-aminobutyrate aminotransferase-like enzyme
MARRYKSDRRALNLARRVVREHNLLARPQAYHGLSTDATAALARGYRAMSVMGFDVDGRIPNWHWHTDVTENVSPELVELASAFVTALVREL